MEEVHLEIRGDPQYADLCVDMEPTGGIGLKVDDSSGPNDYEKLTHKPSLNGVIIRGEKTFEDYGEGTLTNAEIKEIVDKQFKEIFGGR